MGLSLEVLAPGLDHFHDDFIYNFTHYSIENPHILYASMDQFNILAAFHRDNSGFNDDIDIISTTVTFTALLQVPCEQSGSG